MKTQNALLALIKMHPDITGYQLKSIIDSSSGNMTRIHLSRIYPALKKMTEDGLLTCRHVPVNGRLDKKFYSLTPKGEEALEDWLREPFPFTQARGCFDDYLIKLSGMAYLGPERICSYIDEGLEWLHDLLDYSVNALEDVDLSFIVSGGTEYADSYIELWNHERGFLIEETENRIAWLEKLRAEYAMRIEGAAGHDRDTVGGK